MLDTVEFLLREALTSLRRNNWMTFAAVTTATMALLILGGLSYAYFRTAAFAQSLQSRFEMKVFLKMDVEPSEAEALGPKIGALPGVKGVVFKDRTKVFADFVKDNPEIDIKGLDLDNPMPDTYTVTFSDLKQAKAIAEATRKFESVDQVRYLSDEQEFLDTLLTGMRWMGVVLGGLMLATSGVLIYNTIRLTIMARRREIKIMQLVGATRAMVWTPMLMEGVVQGAFGGALAGVILWVAYVIVSRPFVDSMSSTQVHESFPVGSVTAILCITGAMYGLVCSLIAVREPRKRRTA